MNLITTPIAIFVLLVFIALTYDTTIPLFRRAISRLKALARNLKDSFFNYLGKSKVLRATLILTILGLIIYRAYQFFSDQLGSPQYLTVNHLFKIVAKHAVYILPILLLFLLILWVFHTKRTENMSSTPVEPALINHGTSEKHEKEGDEPLNSLRLSGQTVILKHPIIRKLLLISASLFTTLIVTVLLVLAVLVIIPDGRFQGHTVLFTLYFFPVYLFVIYKVIKHSYFEDLDPNSKFFEIYFPPSLNISGTNYSRDSYFVVTIEHIRKTKTIVIKELLLLTPPYIFIISLFVFEKSKLDMLILIKPSIAFCIGLYVTFAHYRKRLKSAKSQKVEIESAGINIQKDGKNMYFHFNEIRKIIIKFINRTDSVDNIQLFIKNKKRIILEGYDDMNLMLNNLIATSVQVTDIPEKIS